MSFPPPDIAYFDGACRPMNPGGWGGWGFVLYDHLMGTLLEGCGVMRPRPDMTNNVAEYAAAGAAVKAYRDTGRSGPLVIRGDSKLVIMQMSGKWGVKQGAYRPVHNRLQALLTTCSFEIRWEWVRREQNSVADALSTKDIPR